MKSIFKKVYLAVLVSAFSFGVTSSVRERINTLTALNAAATSGATYYTNPDQYYSGIDDSLIGADLMVALSSLTTSGFVSNSYESLPNIYRYSDVSPTNNGKLRLVYTGTEISFTPGSMPSGTNKEHVWPASWYGDNKRNEGAGTPGADAHNIWPCASELNSKRGVAAFDELNFATNYKTYELTRDDYTYGTPGDNDSYVWMNRPAATAGVNTDVLYPARGQRGITARILMYVATRYRNDTRFPVMMHDQATTLKSGRIGKLSTLLKWHYEEPPTEWEINRNNEIAARWHHNRNPFIDNPDYAARIFYYLPEPGQTSPTLAVKNAIDTYATKDEKLTLDKTSVTLEVGSSMQINITDNPLSETVSWSSLDNTIASVNSSGLINALSPGQTSIIAQGSATSAEVSVKVVPVGGENIYVEDLSFSPVTETLRVGASKTLIPTISPSDATNQNLVWNSSNHQVATVNDAGVVAALNIGNATITATTTDGSNLSASVSFTVTAKNTSTTSGWYLVTDAASLSVGDELVIAERTNNVTAGDIASKVLSSVNSTFSSDKNEITTLNPSSSIFTLGGQRGAWTFTNTRGEKLGDTSEKNLEWNGGTTTWIITISSDEATINSTKNAHKIQYNKEHPRFTTYNSTQIKPQLYRYTSDEGDTVKNEVYDYVSRFMEDTAPECAVGNVLSTTWNALSLAYDELSNDAKDYFYNFSEEDAMILALIDRYTVILNKYHYENFLLNSSGNEIVFSEKQERIPNENVSALTFIFITSVLSFFGLSLIMKNKQSYKKTR